MSNRDSVDSRNVDLYHMSDKFYNALMSYLDKNNITLDQLCDEMMLPRYFIGKVVDRKIRAGTYRSLLIKIAKYIGIYQNKEEFDDIQPRIVRY